MCNIDELIREYCPKGVEYKTLEELGSLYGGLTGKSKDDFKDGNAKFITYMNVFSNISVDTSRNDFVKIKSDERQRKLEKGDVLFTGSSENPDECGMSSVVVEEPAEPLYLNSFCFIFRLNDTDIFMPDFLKYLFRDTAIRKQISKTASGVTRFNVSKKRFSKVVIPIPPLEVQKEIASILDKFTELEAELSAELSAELNARRKQYVYYRNRLFMFDEQSEEVKWLRLSDIARVTIGEFVHKNKQNPNGLYPVYNGGRSETGYFDEYNNTGEKIVISARGAYAGFVNRVMKPYWAGNSSYSIAITDKNKVNWHYVYYYLKSSESKFTEQQQKGGIPAVSKKQVEVFKIPIPPLDQQDRIVTILDQFDTLVNDISSGIPAEINVRRQQYEYYRSKLLTFQELPA